MDALEKVVRFCCHAAHTGGRFNGKKIIRRCLAEIQPDKDYTEYTPGWLAEAGDKRKIILQDISNAVYSDSDQDIMSFTMGKGKSGLEREGYYAGWLVVGYWKKMV
jgi:hypothetical protein